MKADDLKAAWFNSKTGETAGSDYCAAFIRESPGDRYSWPDCEAFQEEVNAMNTTTKTIDELLKTNASPLPLEVIPNNMGINLCSVDAITWTRQDDGQLVSLTIHFIPKP